MCFEELREVPQQDEDGTVDISYLVVAVVHRLEQVQDQERKRQPADAEQQKYRHIGNKLPFECPQKQSHNIILIDVGVGLVLFLDELFELCHKFFEDVGRSVIVAYLFEVMGG